MADKDYSNEFSENAFWDKIKQYAQKAGESVLEPALKLYFCLKDADTPAMAKATIIAALGYFISPIDAIPDIIPVMGFTDDLGILAAAVAAVAAHIKKEHEKMAREKLKQWFG